VTLVVISISRNSEAYFSHILRSLDDSTVLLSIGLAPNVQLTVNRFPWCHFPGQFFNIFLAAAKCQVIQKSSQPVYCKFTAMPSLPVERLWKWVNIW